MQGYILQKLKERGQDWDHVAFHKGDDLHLNDYGNKLWFECMREWFEDQWQRYEENPSTGRDLALPAPMRGDRHVAGGGAQPAGEGSGLAQVGDALEGRHEHVLGQVLGVEPAAVRQHDAVHDGRELAVQLAERSAIAAAGALDERDRDVAVVPCCFDLQRVIQSSRVTGVGGASTRSA